MKKFPLRVPDDTFKFVEKQVAEGKYQSANQYVVSAITEKNERLIAQEKKEE